MTTPLTKQQRYLANRSAAVTSGKIPTAVVVSDLTDDQLYPTRKYTVTFGCGHRNTFREPKPFRGDINWCYGCMDYQEVRLCWLQK